MSESSSDRAAIEAEIERLEREVAAAKERVTAARRTLPAEPVAEYVFGLAGGSTATLAELFGDKNDLIVVHNMGRSCPYCTLWADGFSGLAPELASRAAFVASRGWRFRMASAARRSFVGDMGYLKDEGNWPGISAFRKRADGTVERVSHCYLGPGDDFCAAWHLFDLLPDGANGWEPRYRV